jgi:hypothetical protein
MGFNSNLEKTTDGMSLPEYIAAVKTRRKIIDGKDTYGRWTRHIRECHKAGTSVAQCANYIASIYDGDK